MRLASFFYQRGDTRIDFRPPEPRHPLLSEVLGALNVTLLVGANGSGKTALVSTLVRLFHHVDWKHERIPAPCGATYVLPDVKEPIQLLFADGAISIEVGSGRSAPILDTTQGRKSSNDERIESLLPQVICSVFSTRGEYPSEKQWNARGMRKTRIYDTALLYGTDHYNIGSLSRGLRLLCSKEFQNARNALESVVGLTVTNRIRVYPTGELTRRAFDLSYDTDWDPDDWYGREAEWRRVREVLPWVNPGWLQINDELRDAEEQGLLYVNDVQLVHKQRVLSLMTLSAGQKMLLVRLLSILSTIQDGSLIVLEEPELHLDPNWCSGLIQLFGAFFSSFRAHMIVTTQSPSVMRCFPSSCVLHLTPTGFESPAAELFLASESLVADTLYRPGALTSLDQAVMSKIEALPPERQKEALAFLGEGPVRFLASLRKEKRES